MKKVLIYRIGEIGDSIVAIPTLRAIIDEFKLNDCEVHFLKKVGQKITLLDFIYDEIKIKKIFEIGPRENFFSYFIKCINFRKEKYDYLFYLNPTRTRFQIFRDRFFFSFCKIKKIYGLSYRYQKNETDDEDSKRCEHESVRLYKTIFKKKPSINFYKKYYFIKYQNNKNLLHQIQFNKKFINIGISLFSKDETRNWKLEKWSKLLILIQKYCSKLKFYFFGGKNDFNKVYNFLKKNKKINAINLCGLHDLKSDIFLISKMNYFISINSGNAHIASILNIPTLVIQCPFIFKGVWNPINSIIMNASCDCQGKGSKSCELNHRKCIMSLSPSLVLKNFINTLN